MAKSRGGKKNAQKDQKACEAEITAAAAEVAAAVASDDVKPAPVVEAEVVEADKPTPVAEPVAPKAKAKAKLPSWLEPAVQEVVEPAPAAEPTAPVVAESAPVAEAVAPAPVASAHAPAPADDGTLLGAPVMAQEDDAVDAMLAPTAVVSDVKIPEEVHPLACIVGGFTAPLNLEKKAEPSQEDSTPKAAVTNTANISPDKLKDEIEHLDSIVEAVESLDYLKPRMKKIKLSGCEMRDLVGLYRMVSQVLLDNMRTQLNAMRQMRQRYEKRLSEVVVEKSAQFVKMVADGTMPSRAEREAMEAQAAPEGGNFMLRKQLEIKEELLLKAREAVAEAEARCEKITRDVTNIRQRQEKDIALQLQKSRESLFNKILPTLDSFDSAIIASKRFTDVASVVEGMTNIHRQLLDACTSEGLMPIEAKDQPFDPNLHEAMGYVTNPDLPEDTVVTELRRGYMLNDKLLRATMVQVSRPS